MINVIQPSVKIYFDKDGVSYLKDLEEFGRTCYKSEDKITETSYIKFIKNILARNHESVIEHKSITVRIICNRGVTHEIVRHRLASYSQESTRYCNYGNKELTFIRPCFFGENSKEYIKWYCSMVHVADSYLRLLKYGATPQQAREVLPNSLKTEIVMTCNLRSWRHFFKLRCNKASHPEMQKVAKMILAGMADHIPIIFDDLKEEYLNPLAK
jgi:thymidylate synthase (FAD)